MEPLGKGDPRRVGPYRLQARLGGGGMGRVYLGRSRGGRPVAVKVVRPELAADPGFRRRFTIEVQAARRVGGFHTAQVVDADPDADPPWLVTAYIPGLTLHAAVQEEGPLPPASVVRLGAGLAEGLAAIHACGLVHRDLKPSNVILANDGPRVIDFGIARALDATSHTVSQAVVGTPAFMSPEQAHGDEIGPSSDVFSLGAVLAFAATGLSPFGTGPAHAVMYRVVHDKPALDGVPLGLRKLVASCLSKDPGSRPTVADVLCRLTEHHTTELSSPPPDHSAAPVNPEPKSRPGTGDAADGGAGTAAESTAPRFSFAGGFGLSGVVNPAEKCPDCGSEGALPTDLFCREHDRFLPLVNRISVRRVGIVLSASVLVYAFFWLAAVLESSVPALLAVTTIGMLTYLLPLRTHHVRTVGTAAIAYAITFGVTFLINATDGDSRQRLVAGAFFAGMTMLAVHAGLRVLGKAGGAEQSYARGQENGVIAQGAIPAVVAMIAGLGWLLTPLFLNGAHTDVARDINLFLALLALLTALSISCAVGLTEGLRHMRRGSPRLPRSRRPRHVTWRATFSDVRRGRTVTVVDRVGDLSRIMTIRIADVLRITLVTTTRVAVNTLADLSHLLMLLAIEAINMIVKVGVYTLRALLAVAARSSEAAVKILGSGLSVGASSFTSLALPVAALLGAAALSAPLSEHLRDYFVTGAVAELGWFTLQATAAFTLISVAWILSAYQSVHRSLLSAYRSANVTGPYLLVFIAIGGWLSTTFSLVGLGDVRAGWATWTATAILAAALAWYQLPHRKNR